MKQTLALEDWLTENLDEILQTQEFTKDGLSDVPGVLGEQLSRAQREYARMGYVLAEAESYLIKARATATLEVFKDPAFEFFAAAERKIIVDDRVRDIKRLRDSLEVTVAALKQKCFAIMNSRNFMAGERPLNTEN